MPVAATPPAETDRRAVDPAPPWTFGIGSLLAIMILVGVALWLWIQAMPLGILFSMLALTALLRTAGTVAGRRQAGLPASLPRRVMMFGISFLLVTVVCAATFAALMLTRMLAGYLLAEFGFRDAAELVAGLAGIAAAAATFTCALLWVLPTDK